MSAEETVLLNLFDSYWFEYGVFTAKPSSSKLKNAPVLGQNLNRVITLMRKSHSDQFLSSKDCSSDSSPTSVLGPQLQTILSGKEVRSSQDSSSPPPPRKQELMSSDTASVDSSRSHTVRRVSRTKHAGCRKIRRSGSRSLSELEFEELKGFMDLGFVFSDEDRDSRLVSIIPGLQRLGKNVQEESGKERGEAPSTAVSRPYLSEAWECLEDEKIVKNNPLIDWRIPAFGNETELKDHLRFWAHTVASAVR
ncbi:uncharacterized protein LOC105165845 [Sesamum indicum]|uniref:Uncharacterized protein LOC105165845 n=1 Tax=Sesamum indicum TaxID=4182 RepID=A0A6I9TE84_SESIN|nr:uncharacterized protein LOC105165845 [Sesamum indicum]